MKNKTAFTLVELLVVIATIALLLAILMPTLGAARSQGKSAVCKNNLHQLIMANIGYALENNGSFVLAAQDIYTTNNMRWHGARQNNNSEFDWRKSPLISYLGDGSIKQCPHRTNFRKGQPWEYNYEDGSGGYGYNMMYIGSRLWQKTGSRDAERAVKNTEVTVSGQTVMFADCAMAKKDNGSIYYIEYSFAEPPINSFGFAWPSIHFRHRGLANVGWVDGHITAEKMTKFNIVIDDGIDSENVLLGWFGPVNNSLFDLK